MAALYLLLLSLAFTSTCSLVSRFEPLHGPVGGPTAELIDLPARVGGIVQDDHLHNNKVRVASPDCALDYPTVTLAGGEQVRINSSNLLQGHPNTTLCGWNFKTSPDYGLTLRCSDILLARRDYLEVWDPLTSRRYRTSSRRRNFSYHFRGSEGQLGLLRINDKSESQDFSCTVHAAPRLPSTACKCGQKRVVSRIVGGTATAANEYPWMVFLGVNARTLRCGGSLVSARWIVTAEHCVHGYTGPLYAVLGKHNRNSPSRPAVLRKVLQRIHHREYNAASHDNDIALLRIQPIEWNKHPLIRPLCLPDNVEDQYEEDTATATGWGATSYGGSLAVVLMHVDLPVLNNSLCNSLYSPINITQHMICAGPIQGGKDSCQGDSGGPLIVPDGSNYELVGIVSFGVMCAQPNYPGVYTRVTEYVTWIREHTGSDGYCPRA